MLTFPQDRLPVSRVNHIPVADASSHVIASPILGNILFEAMRSRIIP